MIKFIKQRLSDGAERKVCHASYIYGVLSSVSLGLMVSLFANPIEKPFIVLLILIGTGIIGEGFRRLLPNK